MEVMMSTSTTCRVLAAAAAAALAGLGAARAEDAVSRGMLVVTVDGVRSAVGHVRGAVFDRKEGFPDQESAALRGAAVEIKDDRIEVRFDALPYGEYAVSLYHDENDDQRLNKKLFGIPKEGYGVSNNVVHAMRPPRFDEAIFRLDAPVKELTVHVHY